MREGAAGLVEDRGLEVLDRAAVDEEWLKKGALGDLCEGGWLVEAAAAVEVASGRVVGEVVG